MSKKASSAFPVTRTQSGQLAPRLPQSCRYRDEWLRQADDFKKGSYGEDPRTAIFTTTTLEEIEIEGETALVRKKFNGGIKRAMASWT